MFNEFHPFSSEVNTLLFTVLPCNCSQKTANDPRQRGIPQEKHGVKEAEEEEEGGKKEEEKRMMRRNWVVWRR